MNRAGAMRCRATVRATGRAGGCRAQVPVGPARTVRDHMRNDSWRPDMLFNVTIATAPFKREQHLGIYVEAILDLFVIQAAKVKVSRVDIAAESEW
jgi:hypothetical protein